MINKVILVNGAQWGDEGKGKICYYLSQFTDVAVRSNGGSNAEHTFIHQGETIRFRILPVGMARGNVGLITNNVLITLRILLNDLQTLKNINSNPSQCIISKNAHVILDKHIILDTELDKKINIGTIKQGIGPAAAEKRLRIGVTLSTLLSQLSEHYPELHRLAISLQEFIGSTSNYLYQQSHANKTILLEGAQGFMLDNTYGTYPHVTASDLSSAGLLSGAGLPINSVMRNIGICKAYITRYSTGFFPTRCNSYEEQSLREVGCEYDTETSKPILCGWFDLVALKFAKHINQYSELALNKMDALSYLDEIPVCHQYRYKGKNIDFLAEWSHMDKANCNPIYKKLKGWKKSIRGVSVFEELPQEAKDYISYIEDRIEIPITMIGTGPEDKDIIIRKKNI